MDSDLITLTSPAYRELSGNLRKAILLLDRLIDEHRPSILQEVYLTGEEIREVFGLSVRTLQNYRDNRQIPYTMIGGKILYPQSALQHLLEYHFVKAIR